MWGLETLRALNEKRIKELKELRDRRLKESPKKK